MYIEITLNQVYNNYRNKEIAKKKGRMISMWNLSRIMKKAWEIKKSNSQNIFGECLKMAWAIAKDSIKPIFDFGEVKEWFLLKTLSNEELTAYRTGIPFVAKETEKAVLIKNDTKYGVISFWCPKSCTMTLEEKEAERNSIEYRMERGFLYNEKLLDYAKKNGVKGVRSKMRTVTLIRKIEEAGLAVPARI